MNVLKGKIFGMPRWLFFVLLMFGLAIGLYLRSRAAGGGEGEATPAEDYSADTGDPVGELAANEPGLAGAAVFAPSPGNVFPVSTPYIPEGFTDVIGTLTGGLVDVVTSDPPNAVEVPAEVIPPNPIAPMPGPPKRRPHTIPKKRAQPQTHARYLTQLRAIRKRHGNNSPEVQRFRERNPSGKV